MVMYVQKYGLEKRPFRANPVGSDVFVGPQTVTAIAGLKTALNSNDSIVAVQGPAGIGKTTLVSRTLDAVGEDRIAIRVSRMRLKSEDVLELLLSELGDDEIPNGTIRRFRAFRQRLAELEAANTRVFVVIEDAPRIGADTLAEIEALTAADAGASDGAGIVLMGDERLDSLLADPSLVRLIQRTRLKFITAPLSAAELRGYMRHCFRLAGGDFEKLFDDQAVDYLHHLSDGIPRAANSIVESSLTAAAAMDADKVETSLLLRVAENEFGLKADDFTPASAAPPAPADEPAAEESAESVPEPTPEPESVAEPVTEPEPEPESQPESEPVIVFSEEDADEPEIPELIQDTLPDLEILAPELAAAAAELPELQPEPASEPEPEPEPIPELQLEADSDEPPPIPELQPESLAKAPEPVTELQLESDPPESTGAEVPEWERDPTLAQLKPDLEALEMAMADSKVDDDDDVPEPEPEQSAQPDPVMPEPVPDEIPEITLDHAISQRINEKLIDVPGSVSPENSDNVPSGDGELPAVKIPAGKAKQADAELEKIASELAKAKSLEDVDDKMAETLFGEELSIAAAQVMASPPQEDEEQIDQVVASGEVVSGQIAAAGGDGVEVTLDSSEGDNYDPLSASQRLKTVRALNADLHPSMGEPNESAANEPPAAPEPPPESIEDQINTSMTQTLKALDVTPPVSSGVFDEDDDDDEESKGGFFSRFRRS